jgi:hypothetical protein
MGARFDATCRACGHVFAASEGGGRHFEALRCDACGGARTVRHEEVPDALAELRRQLGLAGAIDSDEEALAAFDRATEAFHVALEAYAGGCECGGRYRFGAPLRCPRCRSTEVECGKTNRLFD